MSSHNDASEDQFRIHFEQAPFSIQLLAPNGQTKAVNKAWKDLWKIPDELIQNYILKEYNVLKDPQLVANGIMPFLEKGFRGESSEIPPIFYNPEDLGIKGEPRWVSAFIYPVKDRAGNIMEVVLTHQDVTRAKNAEDELRRSRDQLNVIFQSVADGILVQNPSFQCVYANDVGAKMCGFPSVEEFCNASIPELLSKFEILNDQGTPLPLDQLPARQALAGNPTPTDAILRVRHKATGIESWSVVTARPVLDSSGKPYLAVSIFRDITAQKRQEERQTFINIATELLSSSLDYNETLHKVAQLAVPRLADWCSIDIIENETPRSVAVAHQDPCKLKLAQELSFKYPPDWNASTGSPQVIRTGKSELYAEIPQELLAAVAQDAEHLKIIQELGLKSAMVVPLKANHKVLGAITFIIAESSKKYSHSDLEMAEELGRRSGLALENARLYKFVQEALVSRDLERKKFETLFEESPAIMAVVRGPHFIFEKTNTAYQQLIGHRDLLEKPIFEALPELQNTPLPGILMNVYKTGEPYFIKETKTTIQRLPLGPLDEVYLDFTYQRINGPTGEPYGIIATAIDVTEQVLSRIKVETLASELQDAVRARDEFISICSHELKTPVTSMKLQFQTAARQLAKGDAKAASVQSTEKRVRNAIRQLDRMSHLIEEMLDVSRISSGHLKLNKEALNFYELTQEVLERFSEQFAVLDLTVKLDAISEPAWVYGDRYRLEQVLSNLLTNAVKYGAGRPVSLSVTVSEDSIRLAVKDQGIGISATNLGRIFDRFERAISASTISGLGLGLYISRQIVQAHGGQIWAESETNHGSTFYVVLQRLNPR